MLIKCQVPRPGCCSLDYNAVGKTAGDLPSELMFKVTLKSVLISLETVEKFTVISVPQYAS